MLTPDGKIYHPSFAATEQIEEPLLIKHGTRYARDYLNTVLADLQTHYETPDREPNFGLISFADHITPNSGSSAKIQWMLGRSGLVEHVSGVGVYKVSEQRLTDYGAEEITTAYARRKELPADYRLGEPAIIDPDSTYDYKVDVPTLLTQRIGAEALTDAEPMAAETAADS